MLVPDEKVRKLTQKLLKEEGITIVSYSPVEVCIPEEENKNRIEMKDD